MIMPYDHFGRDQVVYTIESRCRELPDMDYNDGSKTIFLYTKGSKGEVSIEVKQLLKYFEHTIPQNALNDDLKQIQKMVEHVKYDEEVSRAYMRLMGDEVYLRLNAEEAERKGLEKGLREGISKGIVVAVDTFRELGMSEKVILEKIMEKFSLTEEEAKEVMGSDK